MSTTHVLTNIETIDHGERPTGTVILKEKTTGKTQISIGFGETKLQALENAIARIMETEAETDFDYIMNLFSKDLDAAGKHGDLKPVEPGALYAYSIIYSVSPAFLCDECGQPGPIDELRRIEYYINASDENPYIASLHMECVEAGLENTFQCQKCKRQISYDNEYGFAQYLHVKDELTCECCARKLGLWKKD